MISTVLFDVDGTLVDTNYHHAIAWFRAFQRFDITVPLWRIHRAVGMGGDQLIAAVSDDSVEERLGDDLRDAWIEEYEPFLAEVRPLEGAHEILQAVRDLDRTLVLASSGPGDHVEHYLDLIGGRELAQAWTTADDAEETKPAPDLVETAMAKADDSNAVMIGDSVWDVKAAAKAGIDTYALRTGGFSEAELIEAGARKVYDSLDDMRADLETILGSA